MLEDTLTGVQNFIAKFSFSDEKRSLIRIATCKYAKFVDEIGLILLILNSCLT